MSLDDCAQCIDKTGCLFEVRECSVEYCDALYRMYDDFYPKGESQGLPPPAEHDRHRWVEKLLVCAENLVARQEERVVGHSALIPDFDRNDGEYIIFVSKDNRNRGVGTELTRKAIEKAKLLGLRKVWLTVESYNFRAIKLYRRAGFIFVDQGERERTMVLDL